MKKDDFEKSITVRNRAINVYADKHRDQTIGMPVRESPHSRIKEWLVVHPSADEGTIGQWRVSRFEGGTLQRPREATGHTYRATFDKALHAAVVDYRGDLDRAQATKQNPRPSAVKTLWVVMVRTPSGRTVIDNDGETFGTEKEARKAASAAYDADEEGGDWSLRRVTAEEAAALRDRDYDEDGELRSKPKTSNPRPSAFKRKAQKATENTQRAALRAKVRAAEEKTRAVRSRARGVCETAKKRCAAAREIYKTSRKDRDAARELAREYRLIFRAERIREQGMKKDRARGPSIARVSESDDQVLSNIPPELTALWERVKGGIRAGKNISRTEAFLKYAEEHPSEVYAAIETPSDDEYAAAWEASSRRARQNPGQLVALGWLSRLELKNGKAVRVPRSTLLAYDPRVKNGGLVLVYDVKTSRARPPASAVKEYKKTHWGEGGAWGISNGEAPEATTKSRAVGELARVIYTTKKGGDNALTDYDHAFEETLPRLVRGAGGRVQIHGGTYRVTERGIVG